MGKASVSGIGKGNGRGKALLIPHHKRLSIMRAIGAHTSKGRSMNGLVADLCDIVASGEAGL